MQTMLWLALVLIAMPLRAQPRWHVDAASVTFEIVNAGFPVQGTVEGLEADLRFDPLHPEQGVWEASVDAATIHTGIALRDRHLRKPDYFDVGRYPRVHMTSAEIVRTGTDRYVGVFSLCIKEHRRRVTMPFTFLISEPTAILEGTFTMNRLDFGLGEPSLILSEDVVVHVRLVVSNQRVDPIETDY